MNPFYSSNINFGDFNSDGYIDFHASFVNKDTQNQIKES